MISPTRTLTKTISRSLACHRKLGHPLIALASTILLLPVVYLGTLYAEEPSNANDLKKAQQKLRAALASGDEAAVVAAAKAWQAALGDRAGQPEGGAPRRVIINSTPPPNEAATLNYIQKYKEHSAPSLNAYIAGLQQPTSLKTGLRELACLAIADAQTISCGTASRQADQEELIRIADALCQVQRPNGLFPFPDIRTTNEHLGRILARLAEQHPEAIVDGWLVNDVGQGDLQYDNGLCGVAMLEAYGITHDKKYLDAALHAAEWIKTQPVVANWNYNSFSVWFLARLALVTEQKEWLAEASRRCHLGMLPGQMSNGRWFDAHNAKLVYHSILCRALVEMAIANKHFAVTDSAIEEAATLGLNNAAKEIITEGVSVVTVPTEMFSLALRRWKDEESWRIAFEKLAIAGITRTAPGSEIGVYAASYLEYLKKHDAESKTKN